MLRQHQYQYHRRSLFLSSSPTPLFLLYKKTSDVDLRCSATRTSIDCRLVVSREEESHGLLSLERR